MAQAPNAYPEIDVDADFQLLLGNRVDTIKALDQEHEMMRTTGVAAMHTRETALDDTDPWPASRSASAGTTSTG